MRHDVVRLQAGIGGSFRLSRHRRRQSVKLFGAAALTLCCCSIVFLLAWSRPALAETVHVAVVGPMIGTSSAVGVQYEAGVNAALLNLPGGTLLGRPVDVSLHDDSCDKEIAEAVALELVRQPPDVVIGHSCSGATIVAAPIYARHGVLQITPASTNPKVTEMGIGTIFRMIGRDDLQGVLAAQRIARHHADQRLGVMSYPAEYSRDLSSVAVAALAEHGITPVIHLQQVKAAQPSYVDQIETLMDHGVEVLYLVGGGLDNGIFMRQARQMGAEFAVISSDTLVSEVFVQAAGPAAQEVVFTFPPDVGSLTDTAPAIETIKALGHEPMGYTLLAYAAIQVWAEGARRAGSLAADEVAAAMRGKPIATILGQVSFDEKGDLQSESPAFVWYTWEEGRRVVVE